MIVTFDDITWDNEDPVACEKALKQIAVDGAEEEIIRDLQYDDYFGNIDVDLIIKEMFATTGLVGHLVGFMN